MYRGESVGLLEIDGRSQTLKHLDPPVLLNDQTSAPPSGSKVWRGHYAGRFREMTNGRI